jgi:hypothetical protein
MRKYQVGDRQIYSATYAGNTLDGRIESKLIRGQKIPLALLENISLNDDIVSDHNWYPWWGAFELAAINPGDQIRFLATPTPYLKKWEEREWWQVGLSQLCWVQKAGAEFESSPCIAPPTTQKEASWFLSRRLKIAEQNPEDPNQWGVRCRWRDNSFEALLKLIESGWAFFGPNYPYLSGFDSVFQEIEAEGFADRDITHLADIAAWCNAGFPSWESRPETPHYQPITMWRMCSAHEFL